VPLTLSLSLPLVLSTFGLIFVAELPDKTALAALVLATRHSVRHVVVGAWLAFVVQTAVAVAAGSLLQLLPEQPVRVAAGVGFFVFAVLAARRDEAKELKIEQGAVAREDWRQRLPWLTSFLVVFAAEWGDLTQLATAALVAQSHEPLSVAIGATAALWAVTVLAAVTGSQVGRVLAPSLLKWGSVVVFAMVGMLVIGSTLLGPVG